MNRSTRLSPVFSVAILATLALARCTCSEVSGGDPLRRDASGPTYPWADAGTPTGPQVGPNPGGWYPDAGSANTGPTTPTGIGVEVDPSGNLVLAEHSVSGRYLWLANPSGNGSVSKIDADTGKEVARYWTGFPEDGKGRATGLTYQGAHSPSRTAVDLWGDVWIANRAFSGRGSVTKIANSRAMCVDRNHNEKIDTSEDLDGDGVISPGEMITPPAGKESDVEYYDECILFSTALGTGNQISVPRALALSSGLEGGIGDVWVGLWCGMPGTSTFDSHCDTNDNVSAGAAVRLSGDNGEILPVNAAGDLFVRTPIRPYGGATDAFGRVWFGTLGRTVTTAIRASTGEILGPFEDNSAGCGSYGMTVEVRGAKTFVWLAGGYRACKDKVVRFEVTDDATGNGTFRTYDFHGQLGAEKFGYTRGVALDEDGTAWVSADSDGADAEDSSARVARLVGIDGSTGTLRTFANGKKVIDFTAQYAGKPKEGIGVGLVRDVNDKKLVWLAARSGFATAALAETGEILRTTADLGELYTYSDFTGYVLRTFTSPRGTYRASFTGCTSGTQTLWDKLYWDAYVPQGTTLQLYVKTGADAAELNDPATPRFGPFTTSPADLSAANSPGHRLILVEAVLTSLDRVSTPRLQLFKVTFHCGGPEATDAGSVLPLGDAGPIN
ncbi:MAG TPA: hypothetical protein VGK67_32045 [Myxococcales bacterium]|jgi:hypothetical protein